MGAACHQAHALLILFQKVTDSKVSNYVRLFGSVYSNMQALLALPPISIQKVKFYAN